MVDAGSEDALRRMPLVNNAPPIDPPRLPPAPILAGNLADAGVAHLEVEVGIREQSLGECPRPDYWHPFRPVQPLAKVFSWEQRPWQEY